MGLKDHLEEDVGHILDLGLDLNYLHVESMDRPPGASTLIAVAVEKTGAQGGGGDLSAGESEESAGSDGEAERACLLFRRLPCSAPVATPLSPPSEAPAEDEPERCDATQEYRAKVEFALKLGYSEELVRLVLGKLGAEALINDVLGELVKLGSRAEPEAPGPPAPSVPPSSSGSSSSSSSVSSPSGVYRRSSGCQRPDSPLGPADDAENLRPIVLDGSNVAMSHGNKEVFSCRGIQLAVDWFRDRGHKDVTVFVPAWRKEQSRPDALITDQEILRRLEKEKVLVFTPSRRVQGRRVVCYDDRFIVKLAHESDGIIVSNDNYRDLANEKPEWKKFIDERLLMYSFVNDKFMPPDDPLGRHGPSLDNFLRKRPMFLEQRKQPCPYGKKCTYGHKCKFHHPERGPQPQRSVADELRASARSSRGLGEAGLVKSHSAPCPPRPEGKRPAPKRQSEPALRTYSCGDLEDRSEGGAQAEGERRSSAPPPTPSAASSLCGHAQDAKGHTQVGAAPFSYPEPYSRCDSPDLSYYSVINGCSALSLSVEPLDPRGASEASDCSSEGSVSGGSSCDSYGCIVSPEDGHKCRHSRHPLYPAYLRPHPHPQAYHGYPEPVARVQSFGLDDSLPCLPSRFQRSGVATRSSCLGDRPPLPQSPPHLAASPPARASLSTRAEGSSDSRLYQQCVPQSYDSWDSYRSLRHSYPEPRLHPHLPAAPPAQPCYQPFAFQSVPENRERAWRQPWDHAPNVGRPLSEPPPLSRYQDVREKVFSNLCNIFPAELVRRVMARNPHVIDPQELAAAILAEKSTGF